ncbi:MAG: DUF2249 domain-containing protein [Deltaproteobacteria bacterium]|nr:DUF2249 domain-containing protein [Deltaproteobacteria bacterium]
MGAFTKRESSAARRRQIVDATLKLLAEVPLLRLTTRQIAHEVGLSQPALFRHFHNKEELLQAVVGDQREQLGRALVRLLEQHSAPLERIEGLFSLLLRHAAEHPGLVRLLLADSATPDYPGLRRTLNMLTSTKMELVESLLRQALADGSLPPEVDTRAAAQLFVALVQGTLLMRQRAGDHLGAAPEERAPMAMWLASLRAGLPCREDALLDDALDADRVEPAPARAQLLALDVRPILAEGQDPLGAIEQRLAELAPDGALLVTAPFAPHPLMRLLEERHFRLTLEERREGVFSLLICAPDAPELLDLSELPAPEPFEAVLAAVAGLGDDASMLFRVPQMPNLLLPRLAERGFECRVAEHEDGAVLLHVERASATPDDDSDTPA